MTANHDPGLAGKTEDQEIVDLKTLRAIRVLRPLKLVSGVPSKSLSQSTNNNATATGAAYLIKIN